MNLAAMAPADELASLAYCLADPGRDYLVYLPDGGAVTVDLSAVQGELVAEWFDTQEGQAVAAAPAPAGGTREFQTPFGGAAVLYLGAEPADRKAADPGVSE